MEIKADEIAPNGDYPVFGGNGLRGYTSRYNFEGDCAIIGRQGAFCGNVRYFKGRAYMTENAIIAVANENNSTRFLAYLLGVMKLDRFSGQSAQPHIYPKHIGNLLIPDLDIGKVEYFDSIVAPIYLQINEIQQENQRLSGLRDTLLPKLMSGELNVNAKSGLQ